MKKIFTYKKRFAYLPILAWGVPAINGLYYRPIWWRPFYTVQKNNRWIFVHTYMDEVAALHATISLNGGYKYKNGEFI